MLHKENCSRTLDSTLVRLFVERARLGDPEPESVMERLVTRLREGVQTDKCLKHFKPLLERRNIREPVPVRQLGCEGYLSPRGTRYEHGFAVYLNQSCSDRRSRFTLAHEICHTFFYELVPELKFHPHDIDQPEEWLCDRGAAALLMPKQYLSEEPAVENASLQSLEELADLYDVSMATMSLRLQVLDYWSCEFSIWHPTDNHFVLDRIYTLKSKRDWKWGKDDVPRQIWTGHLHRGREWVRCQDEKGNWAGKFVYFEARRHGDSLIALWSSKPFEPPKKDCLFFERKRRQACVDSTAPGNLHSRAIVQHQTQLNFCLLVGCEQATAAPSGSRDNVPNLNELPALREAASERVDLESAGNESRYPMSSNSRGFSKKRRYYPQVMIEHPKIGLDSS